MPELKGVQFLYGFIGILSTLLASISFIGFFLSLCIWDIDSALGTGIIFGFFFFLAFVMGHLMEK